MLVIRNGQMKALAEAGLEERVRAHVTNSFPDRAQELGPDLHLTLRRAIRRAVSHGFSGTDVLQFVDLVVLLGEDFENLPWARAVLRQDPPDRFKFRAVRLYEGALRHLRSEADRESR